MRILLLVSLIFISFFGLFSPVSGASVDDKQLYVRDISIGDNGKTNSVLESFVNDNGLLNSFITPTDGGGQAITNAFVVITYNIKNFFIFIAVAFFLVSAVKLIFSDAGEEAVKKWRSNIIWVSVGIVVMQISYSIWVTLYITDNTGIIGSGLGGKVWRNIFAPLVQILQMLAAFGFIAMMIYAFYRIVTAGGDEEGFKKGKNTLIYSLIGFVLIKIPEPLISFIYGKPDCRNVGPFNLITVGDCALTNPNIAGSLSIFGKFVNFMNGFLAFLGVILIIYAGWLVFISGGDEEKLKKAKRIVIYIFLGLIFLVASHALFRFFILQG